MAKTIKDRYDDDPTAGNDETKTWLFPSDDNEGNPATLTKTQVSDAVATVGAVKDLDDRVAALETGTVPDPTTAFWNVTILDNTLTANVFVSNYTGEAWIIVKDDDTTPTDDSVGATPPTGFTSGLPPVTYGMVTWQSGDLYFYQWDQTNGIVEKLSQTGVSGIIVTPNDTLGPVFDITSFTATAGTEPTTDIVFTFDLGVDAGVGYDRADIHDDISGALVQANVSSLDNVGGFLPGTSYTFHVRQYDTDGNYTASDPWSITTDATTSAGVIEFISSSFAGDEGSSPLVLTLERTGSTTGPIQVTVSTADDVALAGTNYTAISSQVVSWADGVGGNKNVNVTLIDDSSLSNKNFFAYIDDASNTDGASNPAGLIGNINSVLCLINSSVTGIAGFQPDGSGVISIEAETVNKTVTPGGTGSTWTEDSAVPVEYSDGLQMKGPTTEYGTGGTSGTIDHTDAPVLSYPVNLSNVAYDVFIRGYYHRSTNRWIHGNLDWNGVSSEVAGLKGFDFGFYTDGYAGAYIRRWTTPLNVTPTAGAHVFNLHSQDISTEIDKIVFAPSSLSYDPSIVGDAGGAGGDENMGPAESNYSVGSSPEDDPDNATVPITPPPAGTAVPTLYPLNGALNVSTSDNIILTFAGTLPTSTTFIVGPTGGSAISGNVIIGQQTVTFDPSIPLTNGIEYTAIATGTIRDTDGDTKSYDQTWTFNTVIDGAGNVFFLQDFSTQSLGAKGLSDVITMFNANTDDGTILVTNPSGLDTVHVVSDPLSSPSRGNVMRVTHYAGEYSVGCQWKCRWSADNTNKTGSERHADVFFSFDVLFSTIDGRPYEWQVSQKGPRLMAGTLAEAGHLTGSPAVPEGIKAFTSGLGLYNEESYSRAPAAIVTLYTYDAQRTGEDSFLNTSDPEEDIDTYSSANAGKYYTMTDGVWHNIVLRVLMNTADGIGGSAATGGDLKDGLAEVWIDGAKVISRCHMWRWINDLLCDGFWLYEYISVRTATPAPSVDHYVYYDNFKASTTAPNTAPGAGRIIAC